MVSAWSLVEKYNLVRTSFCFYLDIQDSEKSRSLSEKIKQLGLKEEYFLTDNVTHIIRDTLSVASNARWAPREGARTRADAMLQCVRTDDRPVLPATSHQVLPLNKAVILLERIYDKFFKFKELKNYKVFKKPFIKVEFLDKPFRPLYKEFDEWPEFSTEPCPRRELSPSAPDYLVPPFKIGQKMTRKSRPRAREQEDTPKAGYCEMCNKEYTDLTLHRRSPHHLTFVRQHTNFLSLDALIQAGTDPTAFLHKNTPVNGKRHSLRKTCNGDLSPAKNTRPKRSTSPDSTLNGDHSPKNGIDDDRKHNTRCSKRNGDAQTSEERQYYKVVNTKLRSSGGFVKKEPQCNGTKPLVVKFRKVRRSELSVLSDEAEQFMFPKRASSTSSTSSEEEKPSPEPAPALERRRLARPLALKEESSEEDSWPEDKRRRRRRAPVVVKKVRRFPSRAEVTNDPKPEEPPVPEVPEVPKVPKEPSPLREEPVERCMKWEDGKLKYTPAVEQLEFAFERVPNSEPWYETFKRQDEDKAVTRNVPQYFSLYNTNTPKLPYEIGQLPPLKPNCCPLSDLVKKDDKAGPSRSYGTRGMKKQNLKKRTLAIQALESHPRKSPREHASTLAMLGSAGLRRRPDDSKSTASEDTNDSHSTGKEEPRSRVQEASERLQQFLSDEFEEAAELHLPALPQDAAPLPAGPDLLALVADCDDCHLIRDELRTRLPIAKRKGRFKKKNRTGWPHKRKPCRSRSAELTPSAGETTQESSEEDATVKREAESDEDDKPLLVDVKLLLSDKDDGEGRGKRRRGLGASWLQPVVRVARVSAAAARNLRSTGRDRPR